MKYFNTLVLFSITLCNHVLVVSAILYVGDMEILLYLSRSLFFRVHVVMLISKFVLSFV